MSIFKHTIIISMILLSVFVVVYINLNFFISKLTYNKTLNENKLLAYFIKNNIKNKYKDMKFFLQIELQNSKYIDFFKSRVPFRDKILTKNTINNLKDKELFLISNKGNILLSNKEKYINKNIKEYIELPLNKKGGIKSLKAVFDIKEEKFNMISYSNIEYEGMNLGYLILRSYLKYDFFIKNDFIKKDIYIYDYKGITLKKYNLDLNFLLNDIYFKERSNNNIEDYLYTLEGEFSYINIFIKYNIVADNQLLLVTFLITLMIISINTVIIIFYVYFSKKELIFYIKQEIKLLNKISEGNLDMMINNNDNRYDIIKELNKAIIELRNRLNIYIYNIQKDD